jgi:hypothetical protein
MSQITRTAPPSQGRHHRGSSAFIYIGLVFGILCFVGITSGVYFALTAVMGGPRTPVVAHVAQPERHVQVNLQVEINQPGMQKDWPGYRPSAIVVPAHSLVTVTIRNYDLGDTPLPTGSPFGTVQGVVGTAYANGNAYTSLALDKVAHTFTVQQLGVSVPVPGDAMAGMPYSQVSFTFRTGAAGLYYFRCYDPCGTGAIGWQGPMVTKGYMLGTITVQ